MTLNVWIMHYMRNALQHRNLNVIDGFSPHCVGRMGGGLPSGEESARIMAMAATVSGSGALRADFFFRLSRPLSVRSVW